MDLSIHGKATPRHDKVGSAKAGGVAAKKGSGSSMYTTPNAPRQGQGAYQTTKYQADIVQQYTHDNYGGDGEHRLESREATRQHHDRPDCVPALKLGRLVDQDNTLNHPLPYKEDKLDTPNTASTVSWGTNRGDMYSQQGQIKDSKEGWGTPLNTPFALHYPANKQLPSERQMSHRSARKPKGWDEPVVPENLPPPSQRYKEQYKQYQTEMKQSYRDYVQGVEKKAAEQPKGDAVKTTTEQPAQQNNDSTEQVNIQFQDDDILTYLWGQSSAQQNQLKKDAEDLAAEKRKYQVLETVMVDQLSRAVISDPEQNENYSAPMSSHGGRGRIRTLHESKIKTTGTATENLLSKRLNFNARILTRNGRDAHRELCGFYFMNDNTMTIYEYRQFGKKSSALPFIQRGNYSHVIGRRAGQPYVIQDILAGSTFTFDTSKQPTLPESVQQHPVLLVRITDVDEQAKANFVFDGRVPMDRESYELKMRPPFTKQEYEDLKLRLKVQGEVRSKLKKRGVRTLTGLGQHFRKIDKSGDGQLDKTELQKALQLYHINIDQETFESFWHVLDQNGDGQIDYGEFLRGFIGEMNEFRKTLVRKVFQKIDANKTGDITFNDIKKFFTARKHPQVVAGNATEEEVLNSLLDSFQYFKRSDKISYIDFEDYYEGVSLGIDDDQNFADMMKNCWGV